jgi:hypothetical protein
VSDPRPGIIEQCRRDATIGDEGEPGQKLAELEPDRAQAGFDHSAAEVASKKIALLRAHAQLSRSASAALRKK